MKLEDYPTPLTDAARCISHHPQHTLCGWPNGRLGEFDGKHIVTADFARDLERKLRKCRNVMAAIADGLELCGIQERTSVMIRKTLEETK